MMAGLNDSPAFINALAGLVRQKITLPATLSSAARGSH
jgi:hypothetical protein